MTAIEIIVQHGGCWRLACTLERYVVVWAAPMEVVAISDSGVWLGKASLFVQEFEAL